MESSDELEHLAKLKKSSTVTLKAKVVKSGYTVEELAQVTDREILITECLFIAGFGQSSIRKMATPALPTDLTQMMQMLMQERKERKRERETASENARLEREAAKERNEREVEERRLANARYEQLMQGMIEMQRSNKESIERAADKQMADRAQQIEREAGQEAHLLKTFGNLLKLSLSVAPESDMEVCTWLDSVQSAMEHLKVPPHIRGKLLIPFLNKRAKLLVVKMPEDVIDDWGKFVEQLRVGFRQTSSQLLRNLNNAQRKPGESFKSFYHRLEAIYRHYLNSRNVGTFKDLVELLLCDKLKSLMSDQLRSHITSLEVDKWLRIDRLCDVADSLSTDNMSVRQAERAASSNWRSKPSASNAAVASSHAQFNQSARYSPSFKANPKFEKPGGGGVAK